jgi:hypothetical protein
VQRKVGRHWLRTLFGLACLAGVDEGDQRPEHGGVGDGEVVGLGGADDGSVDGIDFGAAAGEDVLEHGGLMAGVGLEGLEDHGLGAFEIGGNAGGAGDGDGFGDDGERHFGTGGDELNLLDGASGDGAEGVEGGIEGDFFPDGGPDIGIGNGVEAGAVEERNGLAEHAAFVEGAMAGVVGEGGAIGVAHADLAAAVGGDVRGAEEVGGDGGDADEDAFAGDEGGDGFDVAQAVLEGEDPGGGSEEVARGQQGGRDLMGLGEEHQEVGNAGGFFGAAGGEVRDGRGAAVGFEAEAVAADGVEVLLVDVEEGDGGTGFGEESAEEGAHGACAEDGDVHWGAAGSL